MSFGTNPYHLGCICSIRELKVYSKKRRMKFTYTCNNCPQLSITEAEKERLRLHGEKCFICDTSMRKDYFIGIQEVITVGTYIRVLSAKQI